MCRFRPAVAAVAYVLSFVSAFAFARQETTDLEQGEKQAAKPLLVSLSGELLKVNRKSDTPPARCSSFGVHLSVKTHDGRTVDIYLGPAAAVDFVTAGLSHGAKVDVNGFQSRGTDKLRYVAQSLTIGDKTVELRDEDLRPVWPGAKLVADLAGKIAVTAAEPSLRGELDPRFGRCSHFIVVDVLEGTAEAFKNTNAATRGHAGVQSAELVTSKGAKVVLTGKCGPKSLGVLSDAEVKVISGCSGTVGEVIEQYLQGKLKVQSND
jgi:predicted Fe-Mo cluster-binding NifX family protein